MSSSPPMTLKDFMKPEYFDSFISSVENLRISMTQDNQILSGHFLCLNIGHSLKRGIALREKGNTLPVDQQNLEKLINSEWNERVSHHSLTTLQERKFNQIQLLPLTENLENLSIHILRRISALPKTLKENPTIQSWG